MGSFSIWHWAIVIFVVVPYIYINYRFCKSYKLLLDSIDPKAKPIPGGLAYLLFVPVFNLLWQIVLLFNVKNSVKRMRELGLTRVEADGGFGYGIAYIVLFLASSFLMDSVAILVAVVLGFVFWILTWNAVVKARKSLTAVQ